MLPAHGLNLLVDTPGCYRWRRRHSSDRRIHLRPPCSGTMARPSTSMRQQPGCWLALARSPLGIRALTAPGNLLRHVYASFVIIGPAIAKNWISVTRATWGYRDPEAALRPSVRCPHRLRTTSLLLHGTCHRCARDTGGVDDCRSPGGRQHDRHSRERNAGRVRSRPTWRYKPDSLHRPAQ